MDIKIGDHVTIEGDVICIYSSDRGTAYAEIDTDNDCFSIIAKDIKTVRPRYKEDILK